MNKFAEGVAIIAKYIPESDTEDHVQGAHEGVFFGWFNWVTQPEDIESLISLGWYEDENSWRYDT